MTRSDLEWLIRECEGYRHNLIEAINICFVPENFSSLKRMQLTIELAREKLAELENGGWQPIATAPRDGMFILVATRGYFGTTRGYVWDYKLLHFNEGWRNYLDQEYDPEILLFWKAAPEPPKGEEYKQFDSHDTHAKCPSCGEWMLNPVGDRMRCGDCDAEYEMKKENPCQK